MVKEQEEKNIAEGSIVGKQKLATYFQDIQARKENLFIPYIVAGDGGFDRLREQILLLEKAGVAAIELGIPFSDPVADGPTIQVAGARALKDGVTLAAVLQFLEETKKERKVPIVLMTYFNPIFVYGVERFAKKCQEVGVDGLIVPDLPMEEEETLANALSAEEIAFIRLVALTSTKERMQQLAQRSEGFLYAVAVTGTTGARTNYADNVGEYLQSLKNYSNVPVLAGFGVSNAEQAQELSAHCDGVIVGSTIVDMFAEGKDASVRQLIKESLPRST